MPPRTKRTAGAAGSDLLRRRWLASLGLIGWLGSLAQPASAQARQGEPTWITAADRRYTRRFAELLLDAPNPEWAAGWQLARDLGRPVVPLLWQMFADERSNVDRRLVLLIAAVLAGGTAEDDRLFSLLDQQKPLMQERTMAAILMALGPRRSRQRDGFLAKVLGPNKEPEDLLTIAARLAAARFPQAATGVAMLESDDPGLLAATAFAGMPIAASSRARPWRRGGRHDGLFVRGALLGEGWRLGLEGTRPSLLDRAEALLGSTDATQSASREAAVLLLARAGRLDPTQPPIEVGLLQLAASQAASREVLRRWLKPTPLARDEDPARLAVAYALWMPVEQVVAQRTEWGREPRIRRHVAVALATRLCALRLERPIEAPLEQVPEWAFVRWASGGAFTSNGAPLDPRLAALGDLIADGRASRKAARDELERFLWCSGSHPGIGPWRAERQLLRDLVLVGSNRGGGKYQPAIKSHERYFPTGLDRDDGFFRIAVELYEFLDRPVAPVPDEHRLR